MKKCLFIFFLGVCCLNSFGQSELKLDSVFQEMVDRPEFHNFFNDTINYLKLKCPDLAPNSKVFYRKPQDKNKNWQNPSHITKQKPKSVVYKLIGKVKKKNRKIIISVNYVELVKGTAGRTFSYSIIYSLKYKKKGNSWKANKNKHGCIYTPMFEDF